MPENAISIAVVGDVIPSRSTWIEPNGRYGIRITPTTLDAEGVPMPAEDEAFDRIAKRLVRMSAALGTEVEMRGDSLAVAVGAAVSA